VNSIFVATSSFLSALILSRKICILSAGLSCATPGMARARVTNITAVLIVTFAKCFRIASAPPGFRFRVSGVRKPVEPETLTLTPAFPPFTNNYFPLVTRHPALGTRYSPLFHLRVDSRDLRSLNTDPTHQSLLIENKSIHTLLQRCR